MPEYTINFETPDPRSMELPYELLRDGGQYYVEVLSGDVYVSGNKEGLLYLAELIARCAIGGYEEYFHVHVSMNSTQSGRPSDTEGPISELVIFAANSNPQPVVAP